MSDEDRTRLDRIEAMLGEILRSIRAVSDETQWRGVCILGAS